MFLPVTSPTKRLNSFCAIWFIFTKFRCLSSKINASFKEHSEESRRLSCVPLSALPAASQALSRGLRTFSAIFHLHNREQGCLILISRSKSGILAAIHPQPFVVA